MIASGGAHVDELVAENLPLSLLEARAPAEAGPEAEGLVGMLEALQGGAGNEAVTALLEELGLDGGKSGESDASAEVVEPGEEPPGPPEAGVEEAGGSAGEGTGGGDGAGGAGDGEGGEDHSKELDQSKPTPPRRRERRQASERPSEEPPESAPR